MIPPPHIVQLFFWELKWCEITDLDTCEITNVFTTTTETVALL